MIRRRFAALGLAAVLAGTSLAACSSTGTESPGGSDASAGATELTWSMWIGGTEDQQLWEGFANQVTEQYGIEMTLISSPFNDYWTKLPTQLAGQDPQCVVALQGPRLAMVKDSILPLNDLTAKNSFDTSVFDETSFDAMKIGDDVYAFPYDTGPEIMFYNKDLFDQAGVTPNPGWTVADFEAAGKALLEKTGKPIFSNTAVEQPLINLALAYNGAFVFNDDSSINATDPKFGEALEWVGSLAKQGLASTATADDTAALNSFLTGETGTYLGGPWDTIDTSNKAKFTVGVTTLPAGPGGGSVMSAGSGFGITKACQHPDEAFKAISVITGEQAAEALASSGRAFVARTAYQHLWYEKAANVVGVEAALGYAQQHSRPEPSSAQSAPFTQLLLQYAPTIVNGEQPAADILQQVQSQLG